MEYAFYTMIGMFVGCCCFLPCLAVCVMHRDREPGSIQPELTFVVPIEPPIHKSEDPC